MATRESDVTLLTAAATEPVILKQNSDDIGWDYGVPVDHQNKEKVLALWPMQLMYLVTFHVLS
jgi:hypothetical protein